MLFSYATTSAAHLVLNMSQNNSCLRLTGIITKTRLYDFDSLKPHFYIAKLRFTGVFVMDMLPTSRISVLISIFVTFKTTYEIRLHMRSGQIWSCKFLEFKSLRSFTVKLDWVPNPPTPSSFCLPFQISSSAVAVLLCCYIAYCNSALVSCWCLFLTSLRKHAYSNILPPKFYHKKTERF